MHSARWKHTQKIASQYSQTKKKEKSSVTHSYYLVPGIIAGSSTKGDVKRP